MLIDDQSLKHARILIVDDEEVNLLLLERILQNAGFDNLESIHDPLLALEAFEREPPDLVCTDLHMPNIDGIEFIRRVTARVPEDSYLPIIMLTADLSAEAEKQALSSGAKDFVNKPFRASQIQLRVYNLLQTRLLHQQLLQQNAQLEDKVLERTTELEAARQDILERLALAAEYRDYVTGQHTQRVGFVAGLIAQRLGMKDDEVELIRRAAPLHDVGKIGIPDNILLKPGKLTDEEYGIMKTHIEVGAKLLSRGHSKLIRLAEKIAFSHHERWDGSGYPLGLKGEEIPLVGQIVAVADVFDTLVNERPYKQAWPVEKAIAEIRSYSGSWFSPKVVQAFLEVLTVKGDLLIKQKPLHSEVDALV